MKNIKNTLIFCIRFIRIFVKRCYEIISTFFFRKELKKLTRKFENIETFFDERKIRDFNSNRVKKNFSIDSQMSITSVKMTMCKMRSIETNRKIKKNDANIVKDEVKKRKFRTKRLKNLKIKIS